MKRNKFGIWIEAMRLRTLPVSVAGVIAGVAYAFKFTWQVEWAPAVICLLFAVLAQISSNFANEYYDYKDGLDKPGREGPRRGVTEGDITPGAMKTATFATLGLACLTGLSLIYRGGWWLLIPGVLIAIGAMAYSAGPWPLSRHALGEVAVTLFFGVAPVCLTFYLQTGDCPWQVWAGSVGFGLMGANVLMCNNIRDIPDDRAVGKTTLATLLGKKKAIVLYVFNTIAASLLVLISFRVTWGAKFASLFYLIAGLMIAHKMQRLEGRPLTKMLAMSSMAMFIAALLFWIPGRI